MVRFVRRRERGATAVEYALLLSLVVFASLGAIENLEDSAEDAYDDRAVELEELPGAEGQNDGSGGTATTLGTTTTTQIDGSPTTTTPTSSTTTSPDGSTSTTTSTSVPKATITSATDVSSSAGSKWTAALEVTIKHGISEGPIHNAAVSVSMTAANGATYSGSCTTDSDGACVVSWSGRRSRHDPVQASVLDVDSNPRWDQVVVNTLLRQP